MSYTILDYRLDLKPLGAVYAPPPVPVCPECGFILFDQETAATPTSELKRSRRGLYLRSARQLSISGLDSPYDPFQSASVSVF